MSVFRSAIRHDQVKSASSTRPSPSDKCTISTPAYFSLDSAAPDLSSSLSSLHITPLSQQSSRIPARNLERVKKELRLPCFKSLGIASPPPALPGAVPGAPLIEDSDSEPRCGAAPLLTPPPDDLEIVKLHRRMNSPPSCSNDPVSSHGRQRTPSGDYGTIDAASSPTHQPNPSSSLRLSDDVAVVDGPWVERVTHKLVAPLRSMPGTHQLQVVSQTLPCQARDSRSRPTFEDVLEKLQGEMSTPPYITLTHAVPVARVMEELPKTPPTTPGVGNNLDDYFAFGAPQTIFTHAAVVPMFHTYSADRTNPLTQLPHHIAAPYSIHVSILERYIPPTMPEEIVDFFGRSTKSYLFDRLSELSLGGSLLLIYPTKAGGRTFARQYIGPIIEPFLRQFVILNGLTSEAAAVLGTMAAVEEMLDFTQMQDRVTAMCQDLSAATAGRTATSTYGLIHAETAEITLDRATWINWYVEQEQSRIRQNLVEYHQAGGRMPGMRNNREVTVGMLARQMVEGIEASQEPAGDAGIEVGIFVISRSQS